MSGRVKLPVAEWLCELGFIDQVFDLDAEHNTVAFDRSDTELLTNGILVAKSAEQVFSVTKKADKKIDLVLGSNSQSTRNFNWNLLAKELKSLGIVIPDEVRSLLKSGDVDVAIDIIHQLYDILEKYQASVRAERAARREKKTKAAVNADIDKLPNGEAIVPQTTTKPDEITEYATNHNRHPVQQHQQQQNIPASKDVKSPPTEKQSHKHDKADDFGTELYRAQHISESHNPIEFFMFIASDILGIRLQQAYALVTSNQSRLKDLLIDGFRDDFADSVRFLQDVLAKMVLLVRVVDESESPSKSFLYIISLISCGLHSQSVDICILTGRILGKLCQMTKDPTVAEAGWQWFENEGYRHIVQSYTRNPQAVSIMLPMIDGLCRRHYKKFFCKILPAEMSSLDYLCICNDIIPVLVSQYSAAEALLTSGAVASLIETCFQYLKADQSEDERLASLTFVTVLWVEFQPFIETRSLGKKILSSLRKGCRSSSLNSQIVSLGCLFELLGALSVTKDTFCPIIYKSIIFSLIETQPGDTVRQYILSNIQLLIDTLPDLPVGFLVEPLVKQVALQGYDNSEFDLFISISRHPTLNPRLASQLIDFFSKIAVNDALYGRLATVPMLVIVNRYLDNEEFATSIVDFCKTGLTLLFKVEQMKGNLIQGSSDIDPEQVLESYHVRKTLILECLAKIVTIRNDNLNRLLQPLFAATQVAFQEAFDDESTPVDPLVRFFKQEPTIVPVPGNSKSEDAPGRQKHVDRTSKGKPLGSPHHSDTSLPLTEELDDAFNEEKKQRQQIQESDDDSIDELFDLRFPSTAGAWNFPVPDFSAAQPKPRVVESPYSQQYISKFAPVSNHPHEYSTNRSASSHPAPSMKPANSQQAQPRFDLSRTNSSQDIQSIQPPARAPPTRIPKPAPSNRGSFPNQAAHQDFIPAPQPRPAPNQRAVSQTPESTAFYIPMGKPPKPNASRPTQNVANIHILDQIPPRSMNDSQNSQRKVSRGSDSARAAIEHAAKVREEKLAQQRRKEEEAAEKEAKIKASASRKFGNVQSKVARK